VLLGHGRFGDGVRAAHARMDSLGVRHEYRDGSGLEHRWDSAWLAEAFRLLVAAPAAS
jgi:hypothetical protein